MMSYFSSSLKSEQAMVQYEEDNYVNTVTAIALNLLKTVHISQFQGKGN